MIYSNTNFLTPGEYNGKWISELDWEKGLENYGDEKTLFLVWSDEENKFFRAREIENPALKGYARPNEAMRVINEIGIGVADDVLKKIPTNVNNLHGVDNDKDGLPDNFEKAVGTNYASVDSDQDGFLDREELENMYSPIAKNEKLFTDSKLVERLSGKILLQVEGEGEIWYLNPIDKKRYYLGSDLEIASIRMHNLGLLDLKNM